MSLPSVYVPFECVTLGARISLEKGVQGGLLYAGHVHPLFDGGLAIGRPLPQEEQPDVALWHRL